MAAGSHLEKVNRHNSAAISDIFTKFGVLVAIGSQQRHVCHFIAKSKMAVGRYFEKEKSQ